MSWITLRVWCPWRAGVAHEAVRLIVAFDCKKQITRIELVADAFSNRHVEGGEPESCRPSSLSKSTSVAAPPYQVDIVLRATTTAAKLTLRSGYRSVLHFDATALPTTDMCQPEPEAQAALQRGARPRAAT